MANSPAELSTPRNGKRGDACGAKEGRAPERKRRSSPQKEPESMDKTKPCALIYSKKKERQLRKNFKISSKKKKKSGNQGVIFFPKLAATMESKWTRSAEFRLSNIRINSALSSSTVSSLTGSPKKWIRISGKKRSIVEMVMFPMAHLPVR